MPKLGRTQLICLLLGLTTLALYWPAIHYDFLNYDDPEYVVNNTAINGGVSEAGLVWALRSAYASNWHPLTWMSHMLDCQIFGLDPSGHHLTNVLLHVANTVLLFLVLRTLVLSSSSRRKEAPTNRSEVKGQEMNAVQSLLASAPTKPEGPIEPRPSALVTRQCAFVAALFAWHPLHVESVAWIAERKDVLSTFFFILSIWAYARYVAKAEGRETMGKVSDSALDYGLALVLFACGLMSKPMVVTLPFVLLLLDYWPLRRLEPSTPRRAEVGQSRINPQLLVAPTCPAIASSRRRKSDVGGSTLTSLFQEKLPFFGLSALGCFATVWAQRANAMTTLDALPLPTRVANALVSYLLYLWKTIWPTDLAVLYPYSRAWSFWEAGGAGILLVVISLAVIWQMRARPYLAVGWFWFVGTLVPVIGLVQVGIQSMADRYTYVPLIGIFIIVAWGLPELIHPCRRRGDEALNTNVESGTRRKIEASPAKRDRLLQENGMQWSVVPCLAVLTVLMMCTHQQLQYWQNSVALFSRAVVVTQNNLRAEYNLGQALDVQGKFEEATGHYLKALEIRPNRIEARADIQSRAHHNLGIIFTTQGKWAEAEAEFRSVLREQPNSGQDRANLAGCLISLSRFDEAVRDCRTAAEVEPANPNIWRWLGVALVRKGQDAEALKAFREAVRLNPNGAVELNELAWFLATDPRDELRNGEEAIGLAERARELTQGREVRCIGTLDAAYAEAGRFAVAIETARQAEELALAQGKTELASAAARRVELYRAGKAYRQN